MNRRRTFQALIVTVACISGAALAQRAVIPSSSAAGPRLAIQGYDPVAYFVESRAVRGNSSIAYDFDGDRYQFSSSENRDRFAANPDRYAPQFSGWCTAGLADGRTVEADPTSFVVREGKLYLFSAPKGVVRVERDPSLLDRAGREFHANRRPRSPSPQ